MVSIFKKELQQFFNSLIGYIVIGVFLLLTSLILWIYPGSNVLDYGYAEMNSFFDLSPYVFFFLIPAVTMRLFADESRSGTLELLLTRPVSVLDVILGKFFGSWLIVIIALIPTLVYYISIYFLGNPVGNIDTASVIGSYFGLVLLAAVLISIGLFTSSLSDNQIVAFVLAAVISYFLFDGLGQISSLFLGAMQYFINYFSLSFHYSSLGKGVIDTRNVIFLCSVTALFLFFTQLVINKKRI